jgi:Predicted membrane protein
MIKTIIDLAQFLYTIAPLLFSLAVLTLLCILLSKSIKKHATAYYIVLSIPFFLVAIPFIGRLLGFEAFNLVAIPFLGQILRDYIHMGTFGFPLLLIIMYVGALHPKIPGVKRLLNIRKELSIISGFPVLTHSLVRVIGIFPNSLKFFTNNAEYMETTPVTNELGAGISSFSFVLGIVLLAIFLPLWITSFDSVHKRMGNARWKKIQKWAYVLYAALFIHAMGIQVGYLLNPRVRNVENPATVEATVAQRQTRGSTLNTPTEKQNGRGSENAAQVTGGQQRQSDAGKPATAREQRGQDLKPAKGGGHAPGKGFADIKVSVRVKQYIHIVSLILIFGSYLYFRVRKAKKKSRRAKV